jgi:1-aminocyclopropane-1-carboxylate deaminase/D-cysteine desulfhydrase-like pyridoxal-dependent ACC family enzyme
MRDSIAHPIFNTYPELQQQWVPLITQATPVSRLRDFGQAIGHNHLYVKREDLTAAGYGGNKVRNLEFLLGRAQFHGCNRIAMVAPLGSNFVAAAASQATKIGMTSEFFQFVPTQNKQIHLHARFTQSTGANVHINEGPLLPAILKSSLGLGLRMGQNLATNEKTFRLPMGGSDVLGALGHVNAALELAMQIRRGEIPHVDHLLVGVGTCGTMAGLLVGLRMADLNTKVIGVRCVDKIICNEYQIAALANQLTKKLRLNFKIAVSEICLKN